MPVAPIHFLTRRAPIKRDDLNLAKNILFSDGHVGAVDEILRPLGLKEIPTTMPGNR